MKNQFNIMLIDDNEEVISSFTNYFRSHEVFRILEVAKNGLDAIKKIKELDNIDLIIMDLVIAGTDGINLLDEIKNSKSNPKVMILSSFKNEYVLSKALEYNISYYMLKPYTMENVEKRMKEIMAVSNLVKIDNPNINALISRLLHNLGVPSHIKGYHYVRDCINMMYENPHITGITKELYPKIAKLHDTTSSRVERAIRHAIEVSWSRGDYDLMEELFGHSVDYDRAKPTNSEFIATLTDKLRLDNHK